ncbi:MAG: hypothetical protein ACXW6R_24675, partial [Candidatus Binatia bacterium]
IIVIASSKVRSFMVTPEMNREIPKNIYPAKALSREVRICCHFDQGRNLSPSRSLGMTGIVSSP